MVIVGFSDKTSKPFVRLICGHFKHCVIITQHKNKLILYQFVKQNDVVQIVISKRGIAQLELNGWVFVYLDINASKLDSRRLTCVNFVKNAIGIKNIFIQTPNSLYRYLSKNLA